MKQKIVYNKQQFLNPLHHSDSGIVASKVSYDECSVDASVAIWDCSKKITLDFDCYDYKTACDRATKIDKIVKHLKEVKEALGKAYELQIELKRGEEEYDDFI